MDKLDFAISMILMGNSRISYSKLADMFQLSVNSIYNRVKSLVELGVIQKFKTQLSFLNFPNTTNIIMFGGSPVKDKKYLMDRIGKHECIYNVSQASGDLFYFHAFTRNLIDMESVISKIKDEANINNLVVAIDKGSPSALIEGSVEIKLSDKDYLIVNSLKDNSRKTVSDIAEEINVSTKTVTRHLNRLIKENLINFTIDWYPDKTSEILSFIIIKAKSEIGFKHLNIIQNFEKHYNGHHIFHWNFINIPELMLLCIWTDSMKKIQEIEEYLNNFNLESVEITILIEGKIYPTWIDKFLEAKIEEIKKKNKS